jgi:copper(I)-binding protein
MGAPVLWSSRASVSPRRLLIVGAAALIPVLAGCEAGTNAPTLQWHSGTEGASNIAQHIDVRNVFVLGGPQASAIPAGQSASLFFALVNDGTTSDRLLSISAPGTAKSVTIPGGSIALGSSQVILLTGPQPRAVLNGLTRPLASGTVISIVMNFQKSGTLHLRVPVLGGSPYSTFSPPPPTPTPTTTTPLRTIRKHHRHHHTVPAAGTSVTPSTSPSPTA